jgi:hypothetical protein
MALTHIELTRDLKRRVDDDLNIKDIKSVPENINNDAVLPVYLLNQKQEVTLGQEGDDGLRRGWMTYNFLETTGYVSLCNPSASGTFVNTAGKYTYPVVLENYFIKISWSNGNPNGPGVQRMRPVVEIQAYMAGQYYPIARWEWDSYVPINTSTNYNWYAQSNLFEIQKQLLYHAPNGAEGYWDMSEANKFWPIVNFQMPSHGLPLYCSNHFAQTWAASFRIVMTLPDAHFGGIVGCQFTGWFAFHKACKAINCV